MRGSDIYKQPVIIGFVIKWVSENVDRLLVLNMQDLNETQQ